MYTCGFVYVGVGALGDQKRVLDSLQVEGQAVIMNLRTGSPIQPGNQDVINVGIPGVEVKGGCVLHHVGAGNHTGPLEEQQGTLN